MKYLTFILFLYLLSACASPSGCRSPELAEKTGYRHGSKGLKATPGTWVHSNWHSMCYELNIKPNPVGYTRGYYKGLQEYCSSNSNLKWEKKKDSQVTICKMADPSFCKSKIYLKALAGFLSDEELHSYWNKGLQASARKDSGFFTSSVLRSTSSNQEVITYCQAFHGTNPLQDSRFAAILEESRKASIKDYKQTFCTTQKAYTLGVTAEDYRKDLCTSSAFKKAYDKGLRKYAADQLVKKKKSCGTDSFYNMGKNGQDLNINGCDQFYPKSELISFYRQGREDYLREKEVKAVEALQNGAE